ncbi:MAG: GAF domain-containing protein [Pedobacter sp.]|uniref:GAF domain-containing protein n=1 Tax=Pedobacter sp. TaxID=1411316 RepID=UPI003561EF4D
MPQKELERLQAVHRFLNLNFSKEQDLQDIVNFAANICKVPTALITLIDEHTQYIKFKTGTNLETTSRQVSFCNHIIQREETLMVPDTLQDNRFVNNPLVTEFPSIRFYAGAPLTTQDGHILGSLCVIGQKPKKLTLLQQKTLKILSRQVINILEFESSLKILKEQFIETKSAEIKLRSFFESSNSCHLLIGKNLEILAFNKALAKFIKKVHGVDVKQGATITDYVQKSFLKEFSSNYFKALSGASVEIERELTYTKQKICWHITFEPAYNTDTEIIGVSYNATDITERLKQERKVLTQNESLREIANIQSHQLRKPVASIMGLMNLFKAEGYKATKEELQVLEKATDELDEKIKRIVTHAN